MKSRLRMRLRRVAPIAILIIGVVVAHVAAGESNAQGQDLANPKVRAPWTGDLEGMLDRGLIRVLVSPSRTNFFFDRKDLRGFDVEWMGAFEKKLNADRKWSERVRIVWVPKPFGALLPELKAGRGDIAIGGMTVLPSREQGIVFSDPYMTGVDEVIVHHRRVEGLKNLDDLAGRTITLRTHSSYEVHLKEISEAFPRRGLKPPVIRTIGTRLATEDILEMVNAGIVDLTVADRHLVESWAKVMPNLVIRTDLTISSGGTLAVAVRTGNPQLLESLNRFIRSNKKGTLLGNMLFTRYFNKSRWLKDPSAAIEGATHEMVELFQKYATLYEFDWMDLVAQAFRESRLDNGKRSRAGAVGIMQIKPSTAADPNVGMKNIETLENNIHAGVKYLAFVRDRYFSDSGISASSRLNFSLAAYNAGPRRVVSARKEAADRGLDPNQWFDNVELVVAQTVGREPVDYVRDIRAYVIALGLYEENLKRDLDRESVKD